MLFNILLFESKSIRRSRCQLKFDHESLLLRRFTQMQYFTIF